MNNLLNQVKYLYQKYKIKPDRSKGQNFLIDGEVYKKIIITADLKETDLVLEVGPGFGTLTAELLKKVKKVLAVEADQKFLPILKNLETFNKNLILRNQDILKIRNEVVVQILGATEIDQGIYDYKIAANLPYNISSYFLRKFLSYPPKPRLLILLLQKELAERLIAKPGAMSLLSVSCQFYAEPEIIDTIPRSSFWPNPVVDSALVKLKTINEHEKYQLPTDFNEKKFWQLVKIGFSARRKQLKNNLANGLGLSIEKINKIFNKIGLQETARAQELTIGKWLKIYLVTIAES